MRPELARLMGRANLNYSEGKHQQAIADLQEVIKQAPNNPDPYNTLGLIYEEINQADKAFDCYFLAAQLQKDKELWRRLGRLAQGLGRWEQAVYCHKKGGAAADDESLLWARAMVAVTTGELKKALEPLRQLLRMNPGNAEYAKEAARAYHELKQTEQGIELLEAAVAAPGADLDSLNILVELHMASNEYRRPVELLETLVDVEAPDLPMDLRVNYGMCKARLGDAAVARRHLEPLLSLAPGSFADLLYNVAEMYEGLEPAAAVPYYQHLCRHEEYNIPAIWDRLAACLAAAGDVAEAQTLYEQVAGEGEWRPLVQLLRRTQPATALARVSELAAARPDSLHLTLLHAILRFPRAPAGPSLTPAEFLDTCLGPLTSDAPFSRPEGAKRRRVEREIAGLLGDDDYYRLAVGCVQALLALDRREEAQQLLGPLIRLPLPQARRLRLKYYAALGGAGPARVGALCAEYPASTLLWRLARPDLPALLRAVSKAPPARLLLAHACLGPAPQLAVAEYRACLAANPAPALPALLRLCLAVALLATAALRSAPAARLLLEAFAELREYASQRPAAEAQYNTARAWQQAGLPHLALPLYRALLTSEPPALAPAPGRKKPPRAALAAPPPRLPVPAALRAAAAHNQALLLMRTRPDLARTLLRQHLTI